MSIAELQQQWQKSFEEALTSIEHSITPEPNDYPDLIAYKTLSKWLLETSVSPYEFMPQGWEGFRYNPFSTDSLLSMIHHALIDDGEVSFVKMIHNEEVLRVFMVFCWHNEDSFIPLCRKENQNLIQGRIDSAQRWNDFSHKMQEKYPDKVLNLKTVPQESDFIFVAHHNPLEFIKEVEELEQQQQIRREKSEKTRNELLSKMK